MRFDFRDLELFVAAAESGSIARAAARSHTVPSAVSKRLSALEHAFGTALLARGAKGVELTAAGHALLARAHALLQQARQVEQELHEHARGSRGLVRLWANISSIVEFLPDALAAFAAEHADIRVHLEEHVSAEIAAGVAENNADLGIVSELPSLDGLDLVPFRSDELVLVMRPEHPLAGRAAVPLADALDYDFVGLHAGSSLHHLLTRAAAEAGRSVRLRIRVTSFDAACAMVASGLGLSIVPRAATTAYIQSLSLTAIPLAEPWARRQLYLCTRAGGAQHSAARTLLEYLRVR